MFSQFSSTHNQIKSKLNENNWILLSNAKNSLLQLRKRSPVFHSNQVPFYWLLYFTEMGKLKRFTAIAHAIFGRLRASLAWNAFIHASWALRTDRVGGDLARARLKTWTRTSSKLWENKYQRQLAKRKDSDNSEKKKHQPHESKRWKHYNFPSYLQKYSVNHRYLLLHLLSYCKN